MPERLRITIDEYAAHREDYDGVCTKCGEWTTGGVEPDATGYECQACTEYAVIGAEEALLLGFLDID